MMKINACLPSPPYNFAAAIIQHYAKKLLDLEIDYNDDVAGYQPCLELTINDIFSFSIVKRLDRKPVVYCNYYKAQFEIRHDHLSVVTLAYDLIIAICLMTPETIRDIKVIPPQLIYPEVIDVYANFEQYIGGGYIKTLFDHDEDFEEYLEFTGCLSEYEEKGRALCVKS